MTQTITLRSGADADDILSAVAKAGADARIVFPKNETIRIDKSLSFDLNGRKITFDLNGATLQQGSKMGTVIKVEGGLEQAHGASGLSTKDGKLVIDLKGMPQGIQVGDWVKVTADDKLPNAKHSGNNPVRIGQATKVVDIQGDKLICDPPLHEQGVYKTNIRVAAFETGKFTLVDGTIKGNGDSGAALVSIRSTVNPEVHKVMVRDGGGPGIDFVNTVLAKATEVAAVNLKDDIANGHYGYGVHSAQSYRTTVDGLYGQKVRHTADNNSGSDPANSDMSKYGGDIGMVVKNAISYGTTAAAYSWHSEAKLGVYDSVFAFDSQQLAVLRGVDNVFKNSGGSNMPRGIQLFEYGDGDGKRLLVEDVVLRDMTDKTLVTAGSVTNSIVRNGEFESARQWHFGVGGGVKLENVQRLWDRGGEDETLGGTAGQDIRLGGDGTDTITTGAGDDLVWGGRGADRLTGGAGRDRFLFNDVSEAGDTITDFQAGRGGDVIDLGALLVRGGLMLADSYGSHVKAVQSGADTRILVDLDGAGSGRAVELATLKGVQANSLTGDNIKLTLGTGDSLRLVGLSDSATVDTGLLLG